MFATDTFTPTYSGPIYASGEALRRTRNLAMAQSAFAGNQRAFNPVNTERNIAAGSGARMYQAGLNADTARGEGYAAAQDAMTGNAIGNAGALLQYQTNRANEQNNIRNLILGRDATKQQSALDLRELQKQVQAQEAERRNYATMQGYQRRSSVTGILTGLFG